MQPPPITEHRSIDDRAMRVDVLEFDGTTNNPEDYIDWEDSLEIYFDFKDTPDEHKYKFARVKLTKLAATWLEGVQRQRRREERPKIDSWVKLKKHLRRKYVPSTHKQQLYVSWGNLRQGTRSVSKYIQERERLAVLCDISEPEETKIGRFLGGLREDIMTKLEVVQNLTYEGACSSALAYERQAKNKSGFSFSKAPRPVASKPSFTPQARPSGGETNKNVSKATSTPKDVICFKCHGHGH